MYICSYNRYTIHSKLYTSLFYQHMLHVIAMITSSHPKVVLLGGDHGHCVWSMRSPWQWSEGRVWYWGERDKDNTKNHWHHWSQQRCAQGKGIVTTLMWGECLTVKHNCLLHLIFYIFEGSAVLLPYNFAILFTQKFEGICSKS